MPTCHFSGYTSCTTRWHATKTTSGRLRCSSHSGTLNWKGTAQNNNDSLGHEGNAYSRELNRARTQTFSTAHTVEFPPGSLGLLCLPGNASHVKRYQDVVTILKREDGQDYLALERKSSSINCAASPWDGQDMALFTCSEGWPCVTQRCPTVLFSGHEPLYTPSPSSRRIVLDVRRETGEMSENCIF